MKPSPRVDELQRQLAQARAALTDDLAGALGSAKTLTNWRYHFRARPLWFCGAAMLAGYLAVPRHRQPPSIAIASNEAYRPLQAAEAPSPSLIKALALMAATTIGKELLASARLKGTEWLMRQLHTRARQQTGPQPTSEFTFDDYSHP